MNEREVAMSAQKITIEVTIAASMRDIWHHWNTPAEILQWNTASEDWHTTSSKVDLRVGGAYSSRMEAKDGSFGFDFTGTYTRVVEHELIESKLEDRVLLVEFFPVSGGVTVRETFDADPDHSVEQQEAGWLAILNHFKKHVESLPQA
jgi:uncharacterized protein YndB with AHSA1/START domain